MITPDGCWAEFRAARSATQGRPCLFLDRDGVLIEDTGYPHRPDDIVMVPEAVALVRAARTAGYVAGVVTNQSGLARGLFAWPAFSAVQGIIDAALQAAGTGLDFVLACPYHADAAVPLYRRADHPWRKPAPGMLREAADRLGLDLSRSIMVGDRMSDMEAGAACGVGSCWLLAEPDARIAPPGVSVVPRSGLVTTLRHLSAQGGPAGG